nr:Chain A, LYQLEN peptide derived from human insulin chain A, residues 13-18 [unidentified]2OMP_B Chain B, LYQLEN peptide derived from human insulin chain A, residues 13-18 [unidentified]
LYQLEN